MNCTKVIIPVAGYGTRRLPITKAIEKCMLPVGNRPVVDYVVEDCIRAGITEIIFVVSGDGRQLRDYYAHNKQLETYLQSAGKSDYVSLAQPPRGVTFHFVTQSLEDSKYGTSIPVWLCRSFIADDESALVYMGDDFIYTANGQSQAALLMDAVQEGEAALLGVEVERDTVSRYGVIEVSQVGEYVAIHEKPSPETAPSALINVSKYLLPAKFFSYLEKDIDRDKAGKEYYLIDALNEFVADGNMTRVVPASGVYCDSGTLEGWLAANQYVYDVEHKLDKKS